MRLPAGDRDRLRTILRGRRAALDPVAAGFPARRPGPGRRAAGLSQEQMDLLLNRTAGTYNRFENGQLAHPATDFLTAVARILRFDEQEWAFLWQLTRREQPPHPLHSSSGMSVSPVWQRILDRVGDSVAFVHDAEWNVLAHNDGFRRLFPGARAPDNMMRYMLLDPGARTRVLTHWETQWAPAMMPHLKHAAALRRDNAGLARLERDVLRDPVAGPLYWACASAPIPFYDGSELPVRHAVLGPGRLTTCLADLTASPGARLNISLFTADPDPGTGTSSDPVADFDTRTDRATATGADSSSSGALVVRPGGHGPAA
ncbi:helix-turn-helix transcriptional regulator [Streptomyces sp. NPDC058877]|uniref:helix-turn-helix transcriptional regulator n=1 Tax=Streptomyces sp. NPDC058877 TaxID=3346665 RepID=UPI0036AF4C1E